MISLRNVDLSDFDSLRVYAQSIDSDQYMSRYLPRGQTFEQMQANTFVWKVIVVDKESSGVIWLERTVNAECAVLGIMLFESIHFGKGIGTHAIKLLLSDLEKQKLVRTISLNVRESNQRAISCYKQVGFEAVGSGLKIQNHIEIPYIKMQLSLTF
ncbi:GNAT family N-acetyltransferase [Vibrio harveyi]|uniref:GNAT family N-acetyltransferase n=1 Tax=Vibrio harveyi TaxID=669 RepID=UPI0030F936A5